MSARAPGAGATREETELRALAESMENGVVLFDAQGRVRVANAQFANQFGLEPSRLRHYEGFDSLARAMKGCFHEADAGEEFTARWSEVHQQGHEAAWDELELTRPERRVLERFARPLEDAAGRSIGWLEIYRDLTRERETTARRWQTEKMAALGQLVAGIAHELNNLLTSIMGYAQLLQGRPPGVAGAPDEISAARMIYQEAERAGRIVRNLLVFAREAKPERQPVQLNETIERAVALRSYEIRLENIDLLLDLEPSLPRVSGDAHQLQQALLNLLVNAEQAIRKKRSEAAPMHRAGRIRIRSRALHRGRVLMEVSDDGAGIPPDSVSRVFDPFFTTKPAGAGTGLGLSIVYGIVQEHGGEISVANAEQVSGYRTTFAIELPAITGIQMRSRPGLRRATGDQTPAPAVPARILVLEDEPTVAQLICDVLRGDGHHVNAVLDGREGLRQLLRSAPSRGGARVTPFDLVICDLKMPGVDGQAIFQALVRSKHPAQHSILFVTGDTLARRTTEFLKSNGMPFLAKPFLVEDLKAAVDRMLIRHQARAQTRTAQAALAPMESGLARRGAQSSLRGTSRLRADKRKKR